MAGEVEWREAHGIVGLFLDGVMRGVVRPAPGDGDYWRMELWPRESWPRIEVSGTSAGRPAAMRVLEADLRRAEGLSDGG